MFARYVEILKEHNWKSSAALRSCIAAMKEEMNHKGGWEKTCSHVSVGHSEVVTEVIMANVDVLLPNDTNRNRWSRCVFSTLYIKHVFYR